MAAYAYDSSDESHSVTTTYNVNRTHPVKVKDFSSSTGIKNNA